MSKFKKKLRRAAKIGIGLGVAALAKKAMFDKGADLISGKDSEVGAIASQNKPKIMGKISTKPNADAIKRFKENVPKDVRSKIRSSRGAGDQVGGIQGEKFKMMSAADVRARNKASDARRAVAAKGKERYSLLGSMGFAQGKMIQAKGGKEIVGKKTKIC